MSPTPTVAICIATYKRPNGLGKLLRSLDAQSFESPKPAIEIIVVDNDPEHSAKPVATSHAGPWPVRYISEPQRGISQARNTSVRAVGESTEWIVFIDDDEYASERWLDHLLAAQSAHGCDVVAGPVLGVLPDSAPAWASRGEFFQRERFATGTRRNRAYTNNTLARRSVVQSMSPVFDEALAFRGGSDTFLFRRIHERGHAIVWCDEALVYEDIPASRIRVSWVCKRAYRVGTNIAYYARQLEGPIAGRAKPLATALARFLQGLVLLIPSVFLGKHAVVRQLRWIAYAAGLAAGALGFFYAEYSRHHGQ